MFFNEKNTYFKKQKLINCKCSGSFIKAIIQGFATLRLRHNKKSGQNLSTQINKT